MQIQKFLRCQPWLLEIDYSSLSLLKEDSRTDSILENARFSILSQDILAYFLPRDEQQNVLSSGRYTSEFNLHIEILRDLDPNSRSPPGLFFVIDSVVYFVDHTAMEKILFLNFSSIHKEKAPYFCIQWPNLEMKIGLRDSVNKDFAAESLRKCIKYMETTLKPELSQHRLLINCYKWDSVAEALGMITKHQDSWQQALMLADRVLLEKNIDSKMMRACLTSDSMQTCLSLIRAAPYKNLREKETELNSLCQSYKRSILLPEQYEYYRTCITDLRREVENNISHLLDQLYPVEGPEEGDGATPISLQRTSNLIDSKVISLPSECQTIVFNKLTHC